jgi:hypothetical protein
LKNDWHDFIQRYIAGTLTDDEALALQNALKSDKDLRALYLDYMNLDVALGSHAESRAAVNEILASPITHPSRPVRWLSWRPLTAAAAGLAIGLFSASAVWALAVGQRRATLLHEGFEGRPAITAQSPLAAPGQWAAEASAVVAAEQGVLPKEGQRMLKMGPHPRAKSTRAYYALDLRESLPPASSAREWIEVRVSFRPALPAGKDRYILRAAAFAEELAKVDPLLISHRWGEVQEHALAYAARGLVREPGAAEWQTLSLTLEVPAGARVLILSFWARPEDARTDERRAYYADDVRVTAIHREPLP